MRKKRKSSSRRRRRSAPAAARPDLARVEELISKLTNEFRRQEGRPEVQRNPKLTAAAHSFADYVARTNRFGHTADGSQPWERAKKQGYKYCVIAENIAYEYNSAGFGTEELARSFVEGWKHSPPHRKNMLDPDLTDIGVGVAAQPKDRLLLRRPAVRPAGLEADRISHQQQRGRPREVQAGRPHLFASSPLHPDSRAVPADRADLPFSREGARRRSPARSSRPTANATSSRE